MFIPLHRVFFVDVGDLTCMLIFYFEGLKIVIMMHLQSLHRILWRLSARVCSLYVKCCGNYKHDMFATAT